MAIRKGATKAIVALAHHMLVVIYQVLSRSEEYVDMGGDYYDRRNQPKTVARLLKLSPESGLRGGDPTGCETAPTRIGADGTWQRSGIALTGGRSRPQPASRRTQAKRSTVQMRRAGNYLPAWGHWRE